MCVPKLQPLCIRAGTRRAHRRLQLHVLEGAQLTRAQDVVGVDGIAGVEDRLLLLEQEPSVGADLVRVRARVRAWGLGLGLGLGVWGWG